MTSWSDVSGSMPYEKLPGEGSPPASFQDTRRAPRRVRLFSWIFISGMSVSVGWSKLCHRMAPFDRMTRLPLLRSSATGGEVERPAATPAVTLVDQRTRPSASDKTRLESLVSASLGAMDLPAAIAGASRLATHTTVRSVMLYHMPMYCLSGVELDGEKKPSTKAPPSEALVCPGNSCSPSSILSLADEHNRGKRRRKTTMVVQAVLSITKICIPFCTLQDYRIRRSSFEVHNQIHKL
ncbi:Os09g0551100 [Oryza sativa Japonica Group]|uniref:Os09g0551100 protein n=1 Tax=Oryza sativa subsp. japonica TaxID=39947 RepID=Q69MM5_ORYSJ|nr:unknown protein [Oryza sativa Japonica Group]BAD33885.1 unknown protein [Oryza sativa Japonica Group]BAF25779.1 Os09g0551100 [Oryza sativa Japonica Group]|eukprot:NP_001063865.1 Os09g0551100 [Oryza sativa Japonica Group]